MTSTIRLTLLEKHKVLKGEQRFYEHYSRTLDCVMRFSIYLPKEACEGQACPVLYYLPGLNASEHTFPQKGGFQRFANRYDMMVVSPDTSPRGHALPDSPDLYLGQGASFYLNANQAPWAAHFQMYDYICQELPELVQTHFPSNGLKSLSGHSMGGFAALMIGLRNPEAYRSVSAFAPLCSPEQTGVQKTFKAYLGDDIDWLQWDPCRLMQQNNQYVPLLIDQGSEDEHHDTLHLQTFKEACEVKAYHAEINLRTGYDHSYYFVRSFVMEHFVFHAEALDSGN